MINLRHYDGSLTKAGLAVAAIVFALIFIAIWAIVDVAFGADSFNPHCLTKEQARAKFPNQVIYWHTVNKCWNDVKPGQAVNRALKDGRLPLDGMPHKLQLHDGNGNKLFRSELKPAKPASRPTIVYPQLMPGRGTDDSMMYPGSVTIWVTIADFDDELPPFIPWERRIYFHTHGE